MICAALGARPIKIKNAETISVLLVAGRRPMAYRREELRNPICNERACWGAKKAFV